MQLALGLILAAFGSAAAARGGANSLDIVTFDGASATEHKFTELNDPVMGGQSTGTWTVDSTNKVGVFDGEVVNVPSLKAPGFIKAASDGTFPDASAMANGSFVLKVRTTTPEYAGFRFSFASGAASPAYSCAGGGGLPFSRGCFKTKFSVPAGDDFVEVRLPLRSFSDKWSSATGEQTATCDKEEDVCPTAEALKKIQRLEVWAEGALGKAHLEIQDISIEGPASTGLRGQQLQLSKTAAASTVDVVTFDGAAATTHTFTELNDPVMGGKSTGTWTTDSVNKVGVFDGEVVDVPSLKAPGFITSAADGSFPDLSIAANGSFVLKVRTTTPDYAGFRFSFASGAASTQYSCAGGGSLPFSRGCFKSKAFKVPAGDAFTEIRLPLRSFSDKWSSATGEQTTTCDKEEDVCPTAKKLEKIQRVQFWAEGAAGKVHLEIQDISVEGPTAAVAATEAVSTRPPAAFQTCQGPVQSNLKYGISGRSTPETLAPYVDASESLAEAVCCDSRTEPFAEPRFEYSAPDISLFTKMDAKGVTTFYDSVCGLPVFRAPVNRTMKDFQDDTTEHGWPSFRPEEIFAENIVTNKTSGYVTSKCGTHLGSFLPDDRGDRWCIDLSCISGNAAKEDIAMMQ